MSKKKFFTDDQLCEQPLIESGIIIVPTSIDDMTFKQLFWAIQLGREYHKETPLKLYVMGFGGLSDTTIAICNLIKQDGNIEGYLIGGAYSGHSFIWASCNRRYVYPFAILGIHGNQYSAYEFDGDVHTHRNLLTSISMFNQIYAQILEDACNNPVYNAAFWLNIFENVGVRMTQDYNCNQIIHELQMGERI